MKTALPIEAFGPAILNVVRANRPLVLGAPTGSGKTTGVPRMLLSEIDAAQRLIVLQPRRLATRLVARRVADELGEPLGQTVGFQTRFERCVSKSTHLVFSTEGLFLRQMQANPHLPDIGMVVLDEFHERSIDADLILAWIKQLRAGPRPDLRVAVMSATLDLNATATYLDADIIEARGRTFPITIHYESVRPKAPVWETAADAVVQTLSHEQDGDVLVFMPGQFEIRKTLEACRKQLGSDIELRALYGSLSPTDQDAALAPSTRRRVIVATNVAETSLTIPGIRHVIDSGLARIHRFDPRRGIDTLLIEPISKASADQRAGRAGRTAPGTARRLWTAAEHRGRRETEAPEVRRTDLADTLLRLHVLGIADPESFDWLDPPEVNALRQAEQLLFDLDAIDAQKSITPLGRQLAALPLHPRLGRFLLAASESGGQARAALWAALIAERSIRQGDRRNTDSEDVDWPSDLAYLEQAYLKAETHRFEDRACHRMGLIATACREVSRAREQILSAVQRENPAVRTITTEELTRALLHGFPDRVARHPRADDPACSMPGLKRVILDRHSIAKTPGLILALETHEMGREGSVRTVLSMASVILPDWLIADFPARIRTTTETDWDPTALAVRQWRRTHFGALMIEESDAGAPNPAEAERLIVAQIRQNNLQLERWNESVEQWIARSRFVSQCFPDQNLLAYTDEDVELILHEIVSGATRWKQVEKRDCLAAVMNVMDWSDQQRVRQMAPESIDLPSGKRMPITYADGAPPRGRARIRDLYDLEQTPRIAGGRVPLLLEILAPNGRPVQLTEDLASFWERTYPEVKKDLKRRYPKHEWR